MVINGLNNMSMSKKKAVVFLLWSVSLVILPASVSAQVIINEIAWMGTVASPNDEWMELYNPSDSLVSLDGWVLEAADGTPKINLEGTISASGFFLLERTDDNTVPDIPADQIYTGALSNDGENLILKDVNGATVHQVDASAGWPAGDNTTKETMQWNGSSWITAPGTPKAANPSSGTPPAGDDGEQGSVGGGGGGEEEEVVGEIKPLAGRLKVSSLGKKRIVGTGSSVLFRADSSGAGGAEPRFVWTFGDGSTAEGRKVEHIYKFPGDHIVVLNASAGEEQAAVRGNVKVFQPEIIVTEVQAGSLDDSYIQLENRSAYEVNLGNLRLEAAAGSFIFPPDTIIASKTKINFPSAVTQLTPGSPAAVRLVYPNGRLVVLPQARQDVVSTSTMVSSREAVLAQMRTKVLRLAEEVKKLKPPDFETQPPVAALATASPATTSPATTTVLELPQPAGLLNRGFGFMKNIFSGDD